MVPFTWLGLALLLCLVPLTTSVDSNIVSDTEAYPLPNQGNIITHDPSIIQVNGYYYLFMGGVHIPVHKAANLDGPWEYIGTVLAGPSEIDKVNRTRPWAPMTIEWNNRFYCFYCISDTGRRDSAIGVATSDSIAGTWTDHGVLINTGEGDLAHIYPYNVSNAIDPAFFADPLTGTPYLQYGSFWDGIFQLRLDPTTLTIDHPAHPDSTHLIYVPEPRKPEEGSFMSYKAPYYYLWFSHGKCCQFSRGFPPMGAEYSIRVGRSTSVHGPFTDKQGTDLLGGGGTVVYGSNHGVVYAPGGVGVLTGSGGESDVLYYHYRMYLLATLPR
ncbi:hypothetical protein P175DRAFT_090221 [Aspergillus ochraceoroseus IBT 24754]|nr:uncharacterized protein P175DRAFT_090221 [Aspergillus ochraceoroseus IBT 24754]PTU17470.1 hypothetical protein P175DRAFT_090221 [Aspergillus ochraceoroseus IBT 24754]